MAGTLSYNPSDHSLALEAAITEARRIADNIEKVPPEMRSEVAKNQLGFDGINENRDLEGKVLEGRKS